MTPTNSGAIVTPHYLATQAGNRILGIGGTAVDAAIAASAVLCVVYPHMVSLAGDSWSLLADGSRVRAVDGTGRAPQALNAAVLRERGEEVMPDRGPHTVTVPGGVAAWGLMHAEGGRLAFDELLADAITFAEHGVEVAPSLARDIIDYRPMLEADPGCRALFFAEDGSPKTSADHIVQPQLAATLRAIALGGPGAFYQGPVAEAFVSGMVERGSLLATSDFAGHRSEFFQPITRRYGDAEVLTAPPSSQGFVLLQLLGAVDLVGKPDWTRGTDLTWMPRAADAFGRLRDAVLGDVGTMTVTGEELVSENTIRRVLGEATGFRDPRYAQPTLTGDTIALMAADSEGQVLSHIQSVSGAFGSGILEQSTGMIGHNRGSAFTLQAGDPSELIGGRKPPHTLMPAMVRRDGRVVAVAGTMGGKNQPVIVAQVIARLLEGASAQEAVDAPRWVVPSVAGNEKPTILVESQTDVGSLAMLAQAGMPMEMIEGVDNRLGQAQVILIHDEGLQVGCDRRSDGRRA